ncbi:MAG: hypothetical protein Q4G71_02195 [Pseudomonadota bacterium]|nr:hypothetical protein [Pseudomonadota bacterium]
MSRFKCRMVVPSSAASGKALIAANTVGIGKSSNAATGGEGGADTDI